MHPTMSTMRSVLLSAAAVAAFIAPAQAQIDDSVRGPASEANHFKATPEGWEHPMKPWGEPDIEAMLNMMQAAGVPLVRCAGGRGFGPPCDPDKVWLTEEEYNARVEQAEGRVDRSTQALEEGDLGTSIQTGLTDPSIPQRQTNLIMDPPDGQLPELTPLARELALTWGSDWALPGEDINFQSKEDFDSWDRCITRGMPSMMMPYRYNGGFRITQAPGYVIFDLEMIHEARVIPTTPVEKLDDGVRQYIGDSRGRWEGNTLVIETTNYRDPASINQPLINLAVVGSPPGNRFPVSEQLRTTERIMRLNDDWWLYEITTEDPVMLERPFTVRYPMHHDPEYWWPEYACHEDNTIVPNFVETNRYERANPTPEPPQPPVEVTDAQYELLPGTWMGTPDIHTIDVNIEIEFRGNGDGTVNGYLIGTNLGEINKPLRSFTINGNNISWTFPNVDPWSFRGQITDDGTLTGTVSSAQGSAAVTFSPAD